MKKLFIAYMWATSTERLMEDHEIIMVCANNLEEAKVNAVNKTKLVEWVHIDFIIEINNVDWYDVILKKWWEENIKKVSDYSKI